MIGREKRVLLRHYLEQGVPKAAIGSPGLLGGLPARDQWNGSDPPGGGDGRVKTRTAPRPYQALGPGGRSPPRPCCPVRHRRPGGDERNSKRPHGIGESGVCASSGVHCVHRPPTSHARSSTAQVVGFSSESRPHEPNRPPCVGALHQPPTRLPARTLRQRDAALHGGLQAAVLHEDPDITLDDGPVDPVDLAADFVVEFGGVGISRPVGEHRLRSAPLVRCPDDDHDFDPAAAIPKRLPEFAVRGTPGAERRRGLVARIDVDEDGALGVKRDREPERGVAPEVPGRSPVDPPGQEPALDAERLEGGHLLRLGREPRQLGMIEHVVEREEASHEHFLGGNPPVADVLGA